MKKMISLIVALMLTATVLCAEEKVLLSSSTSATLGEGIGYAENFLATSNSGHFGKKNALKALAPSDKGFRAMAIDVPEFEVTHFQFQAPYPAFVNVDEKGDAVEGAGFIENAATVKSFIVKEVLLNRPYDELFLLYSTSPTGPVIKVKLIPTTTDQEGNVVKNAPVNTMTPIDFVFENSNYNENVKTREIKADPALGGASTGIYFRGLEIKTNPAWGLNEYSPWSIAYFKEIVAIYDKRFTDEQWAMRKELKDEWIIDDGSDAVRAKAIADVKHRKTLEDVEIRKMHQTETESK